MNNDVKNKIVSNVATAVILRIVTIGIIGIGLLILIAVGIHINTKGCFQLNFYGISLDACGESDGGTDTHQPSSTDTNHQTPYQQGPCLEYFTKGKGSTFDYTTDLVADQYLIVDSYQTSIQGSTYTQSITVVAGPWKGNVHVYDGAVCKTDASQFGNALQQRTAAIKLAVPDPQIIYYN